MQFGWKAPFPLRFGARAHDVVDGFYSSIVQNRPEVLRGGGPNAEVDIENKAIARALAIGWWDTERRVAQSDPLALSERHRPVKDPATGTVSYLSMLERWEAILGIHARPDDTVFLRRQNVAARLRGYTSNARIDVQRAMLAIFGPWFQGVFENHVGDVDYPGRVPTGDVIAYWGTAATVFSAQYPGTYDATRPWRTGLAVINVSFQPPDATAQTDIDARVTKALAVLDDMLPAWMSAEISQWATGQTTSGFYAGVSLVGLTAV